MTGETDQNYPPGTSGGETPSGAPEDNKEEKGFLSDGKPLRLSAQEVTDMIDAVIFVPKGSTEAPELAAQQRLSVVSAEHATLTQENVTMKAEIEKLSKANTELGAKLQAIEDAKRLGLATELIDMRIEKGLISKDGKEDAVKKLAVMSEEQLTTAVADYKMLTGEKPQPDPKTGSEPTTKPATLELEGETDEKRQKRNSMFGHEDPIEAVLKNDPTYAGETEVPEVE